MDIASSTTSRNVATGKQALSRIPGWKEVYKYAMCQSRHFNHLKCDSTIPFFSRFALIRFHNGRTSQRAGPAQDDERYVVLPDDLLNDLLANTLIALVLKTTSEPPTIQTVETPQPTLGSAVVRVLQIKVISYTREVMS